MPKRFLSLRWQVLIAFSLVLILVNAALAILAREQALNQFAFQQQLVREQQARQLRAIMREREQEMSKLAPLIPLLGPVNAPSLTEQLRVALETHGALLDLEWDINSVFWLAPDGAVPLLWPEGSAPPPPALRARVREQPEQSLSMLGCVEGCAQYLATPLLWRGHFAGTLVLRRSLADALIAFHALTGAEIAIALGEEHEAEIDRVVVSGFPEPAHFPVMTHPERTLALLRAAGESLAGRIPEEPLTIALGAHWFEIFRVAALAPGVDAYVINEVSAQRAAIQEATRDSLLLGLMGLILSESLLLIFMTAPLSRLREFSAALPLLAEQAYGRLRARLGEQRPSHWLPRDEIDLMSETIHEVTNRMERLQHDRAQAEDRLAWLANHDALTQLLNRRRFNEEFARILDQALRYGHQGALILLDLDAFKEVNELSGHYVGDDLLMRVAERLAQLTRPSDLLARLGGDEFALVLPEASLQEALDCAANVKAAIHGLRLHSRHRQHSVTASIGIVLFPEHGHEPMDLMANVDLAMYQAKHRGRDRWWLFSEQESGREQIDERILWRDRIAEALREDRFELHGQPIQCIESGDIHHFEALVRMLDEDGDIIAPARFIPVAEKTGQIQDIDRWVLSRALQALAGNRSLRLAVNLSASALDDPSIILMLEHSLETLDINPARLSFEITETLAIESLASAIRLMRQIQALGCRFALDDFGSGYASYAYLRQLPVDDIKIDGCFIRDLATNRQDRLFVNAITDMAHGMGKCVVAEYVETAEILAILAELGVDYAQGYHIGRPQPLPSVPPQSRS
ncbi:MAG: EAL domain-containing protein [Chromatiaceae bacterium]|nr:EAL domain-containing protein [Chromatiaceae bacterium]